jgi:hypothetical protein
VQCAGVSARLDWRRFQTCQEPVNYLKSFTILPYLAHRCKPEIWPVGGPPIDIPGRRFGRMGDHAHATAGHRKRPFGAGFHTIGCSFTHQKFSLQFFKFFFPVFHFAPHTARAACAARQVALAKFRCPLSGVKRTGLGLSSPIPIKSGTSCKVSSQQPRLGRLWEDANGFLFQTRKQGRRSLQGRGYS